MNQLSFAQIKGAIPAAQQLKGKQTWILLIAVDEKTDRVVAELSLPESIRKNGFIFDWRERIFLPSTPFGIGSGTQDGDDDGDSPINIEVEPR